MGCGQSTEFGHPQSVNSNYSTQNHQFTNGTVNGGTTSVTRTNEENNQHSPHRQIAPAKLDKTVLKSYLELEQKSRYYEAKNVQQKLKLTQDKLLDLQQTVQQLEKYYDQCKQSTAKEKADVDNMPDVRSFFKTQDQYEERMSKEREEYLDALNKQEVAKKDLDGITGQQNMLRTEKETLEEEVRQLRDIYEKQDSLLANIFDGHYGSELEFRLETTLDTLLTRKQRIGVAKYKWTNAQVLLQQACEQLTVAVRRWHDLQGVEPSNLALRYTFATETRNNLIAANQNISSAQRYLHTIRFPYCNQDELSTLARATNNIYSDMQTAQRHATALQCYSTTQQRARALIQWFTQVINQTIVRDLEKATTDVQRVEKDLRNERSKLIRIKINETLGEEFLPDETKNVDEEIQEDDTRFTSVIEADKVSNAGDIAEPTKEGYKASEDSAVPLDELAPIPKQEDIFGDITRLKDEHQKELNEFNKKQELNKARIDQGLQEKLQARRTRKERQDLQLVE